MHWYMGAFAKYGDFSGRARRMEYWMFTLINMLVMFAIAMLGGLMGDSGSLVMAGGLILYLLIVFVPSLAVGVRRMHDTGRSGWWLLLGAVPLLGLVVLVFTLLDSEPGSNQYGPNPKTSMAYSEA